MQNTKNMNCKTAFSKEQQDELYGLEDQSWWFQYRARVIIEFLDHFFKKEKLTWDIGGGNGYTTLRVKESGYDVGLMEPSAEACKHAIQRGISKVYCGVIDKDNIVDESIEQMLLLDVLEHIENDENFLNLLCQKAVTGGYLLMTVPAHMCLWSSEDNAAGHFRRYKEEQLRVLARKAGFEVVFCSYFMSFLFLPILFVRVGMEKVGFLKKCEERTKKEKEKIAEKQFKSTNKIVNMVLNFFQTKELRKLKRFSKVEFGSSIIMVLRKRTTGG